MNVSAALPQYLLSCVYSSVCGLFSSLCILAKFSLILSLGLGFSFFTLFLFLCFPLGIIPTAFLFLYFLHSVSLPYPVWPVCLSVRLPPASSLLTSQVLCKTSLRLSLSLYTHLSCSLSHPHISTNIWNIFYKEIVHKNISLFTCPHFMLNP